ncbi:MAG TPA: cytochrome c oxidase assembly protein [Gaiellaceae bacterium]|nr:cytochrome c oxidase assembly protein [Gaiellaceae bacterium]
MVFEWPLVGLLAAGVLYALGRRGRDSIRRDACFYAGLVVLVAAIDSPVDGYADRLFWVHMVQHVLLTMVAPPLILIGRPWPRSVRALPMRARRVIARSLHAFRGLAAPRVAFVLFNGVLLAWHLPALFDLTLRNEAVHDLEHALFFFTALLFWTHLTPTSRRPRLGAAQRVAYGVGAILVSWVLAVVLGFASRPLYGHYASLAHRPGGLSALADQQLAAGVMWVPASIPFTIAVLVAAYDLLEPSKKAVVPDLRPRET